MHVDCDALPMHDMVNFKVRLQKAKASTNNEKLNPFCCSHFVVTDIK